MAEAATVRWRVLETLGAALALSLLLVPAAFVGKAAAFPGANGKIAYMSNRDGDSEIYAMNADGTDQTALTDNTAWDGWPAWSPDGSKIAFVSDRDGNTEIYVMNADGSGQTNITNNPAADGGPAWSPDGTKIAFTTSRDGNAEIYVMNANGTSPADLSNNLVDEGSPAWSPDGSKIAFTRDVGASAGRLDIYVMAANGTNQVPLITSPSHDDNANWSPDGSKISFTSDRASIFNPDIYVANADGSGQTRLTTTLNNHYTSWSPDGSKIAFGSYRDGTGEIYVTNPDGTDQTRLTTSAAETANDRPDWQPLRYGFSGVLEPVNTDGSSIFKLGRTVPVKFWLTDSDGQRVAGAVARIFIAKLSDDIVGDETEAGSTSAATEGNLFRYDSAAGQYVFNWGTRGLTAGTWRIRIALDDGTSKYVTVSLK